MAGNLHAAFATIIAAGVPATSKTSANTKVQVATGPVSLVTDVVNFPGPPTTGAWVIGNQKVLVNGVPTVGQSASGQAVNVPAPPPTVPMAVSQGDPKVTGS